MDALLISLQRDIDVIGLKYLHYSLLKGGYKSSLLYLPAFSPDNKVLEQIKKFVSRVNPKFIGISLMSLEFYDARNLTKYLKHNFKSIPIV